MAQSDGLVRLTILSADGHPKGARGHALALAFPNPSQEPSPHRKSRPLFTAFFHRESSRLVENKK